MTSGSISAINICPLNFIEFNAICNKIQNIEATVLYLKLQFFQKKSIIVRKGKTVIARTREQMAQWFNFSSKKIDRLLSILEEKCLIKKEAGLWNGKKALYLYTDNPITNIPLNISIFNELLKITGDLKSTLIFARIAFAFANTKILNKNTRWCCIKKEVLAKWAIISVRSLDKILNKLIRKGLLIKKNFIWKDKIQTHFHIPPFVITLIYSNINSLCKTSEKEPFTNKRSDAAQFQKKIISSETTVATHFNDNNNSAISEKLKQDILNTGVIPTENKSILVEQPEKLNIEEIKDTTSVSSAKTIILPANLSQTKSIQNKSKKNTSVSGHNCLIKTANLSTSIYKRSKEKEKNNTRSNSWLSTEKSFSNESDIIFNTIGKQLTKRQIAYLEGAVRKTIARSKILISSPYEFFEELKFSIIENQQRIGVTEFRHAVSRFMKIVANNNWHTPIGFYKYAEAGIDLNKKKQRQQIEWQKEKENECKKSTRLIDVLKKDEISLTEKAIELSNKLEILYNTKNNQIDENNEKYANHILSGINDLVRKGANWNIIKNRIKKSLNLHN